jgi:hypothetical protein
MYDILSTVCLQMKKLVCCGTSPSEVDSNVSVLISVWCESEKLIIEYTQYTFTGWKTAHTTLMKCLSLSVLYLLLSWAKRWMLNFWSHKLVFWQWCDKALETIYLDSIHHPSFLYKLSFPQVVPFPSSSEEDEKKFYTVRLLDKVALINLWPLDRILIYWAQGRSRVGTSYTCHLKIETEPISKIFLCKELGQLT